MLLKSLFITSLLVFTLQLSAQKVGLVFSGGGAKGLAHIGTLKALEENNIPIDYITGTSMGAIVGAMYAAGYTPQQIEKIALSSDFQNWVSGRYQSDYSFYFQKSAPNPSIVTAKMAIDTSLRLSFRPNLVNDIPLNFALLELFSQASAAAKDNFDNLLIPFRCMASDILSQKSIMVSKGSLTEAVRASMTVPLIYRPIKLDDKFVFDGGIYNNFPADVMQKEFKPDLIIGANVSSKTFNEYPKDDDRLLNRFLVYMFLAKSDSTLVGENGIYIAPNLADFSSTNFLPVEELIKKGYDATIAEIDHIKSKINRRVATSELERKRNEFNSKKAELIFNAISVTGVNSQQRKYIERLFKSDAETFDLSDIKRGYYKLVADEVFEAIYPKISYDAATDSYNFQIVAQPKKAVKIDFGGNISTRPISNVFLGVQYNYLNRRAYTFAANFYSGRFYESAQLSGRIDFPSKTPLFLGAEITYNHWNYYNTSKIFVENPSLTYIDQADRKIDIKFGMPLNRNARIILNTAFINNSDNYSPTQTFVVGDLLDRTVFNGFRANLSFEKNSLNRKQYATAGQNILLSINYTTGSENYSPGNIQVNSLGPQMAPAYSKNLRQWVQAKFSYENYFLKAKKYTLGYLAEVVASNQPLYSNYYSTLIAAPAFYPLQDSRSNFLENFRAYNYAAGGIKNIFNIQRKLDFRVEGYVFLPYQEFKKIGLQGVGFEKTLSTWRYAGTAGLVYQSPLGPISLSYNLYDEAKRKHGALLHIGYLIYNKRSLE
ncbi:patatin-like phospholipase family protein [Pedobacter sp. SL55]|uniref:patatin-like phospholipase family protein n=1 Tax=Pedobacter sp. SL55 TaxID=2995161 RepID=UPI00226FC32E|nr:patatin-like phospholipase family protein [Pedobacter sp. SL55]WAC40691.1 patatin-like phospholipase family protein [Pedobacter sp. SL55]